MNTPSFCGGCNWYQHRPKLSSYDAGTIGAIGLGFKKEALREAPTPAMVHIYPASR